MPDAVRFAIPAVERAVRTVFPHARIAAAQPLAGGLRNTNFKVITDSHDPIVLRFYKHDPALCQKEIDIIRRIRATVPVPEVLHAEPRGLDDLPPFTIARYIEGITFLELKRTGDRIAIAQAARAAGEVLAAIGRFTFDRAGWLGPGPAIASSFDEDRFVDECLSSPILQSRVPADLRDRVRALAAPKFDFHPALVHGDYSRRNLLVHRAGDRWKIAAVLDWEFAVSASPLCDVANFLRYELAAQPISEPHFSAGYVEAGGSLPGNWRSLSKRVDLSALCDMLTREHLAAHLVEEIVELIRATVENRDPILPW